MGIPVQLQFIRNHVEWDEATNIIPILVLPKSRNLFFIHSPAMKFNVGAAHTLYNISIDWTRLEKNTIRATKLSNWLSTSIKFIRLSIAIKFLWLDNAVVITSSRYNKRNAGGVFHMNEERRKEKKRRNNGRNILKVNHVNTHIVE